MAGSSWPRVSLGDHVNLLTGFPFKSKLFTNDPEDIPLVKGENVQQGYIDWEEAKRWPRDDAEEYERYQLKAGDVVLAMDRPWIEAGLKFAWIKKHDPECLLVQRVARMRGDEMLLTDYLRYLVASPPFTAYIRPIVTGVNVPHISPQQIRDFQFDLPPLEFQERAVAILSAFDDLIENSRRRIRILEEIAKTIFTEWFVKFRPPGHEGAALVASPLGKIPKGWHAAPVSEVADVFRGRSYRSDDLARSEGLPFINLKCIERDGGFRLDGLKRYSGDYKATQVAMPGDVVVAVTDLTQQRRVIAHAARVPDFGEQKTVFSMDLVKVAPKGGTASSFVYGALRYTDFPERVKRYANGANVLHLNPAHIGNHVLALPPENLQQQYELVAADVFRQCDILARESAVLKETREVLLSRMVSGELDVSGLDIEVEDRNA